MKSKLSNLKRLKLCKKIAFSTDYNLPLERISKAIEFDDISG
jgi:hypothetical protein